MSPSFKAQVDPLLMKQLIQKSNQKGILHFGIFFLVLFGVGILSFQLLGTYWFFPVYLIYAIIFAFSEAAAHELNHDSVFRSRWLNTSAHWLVCFMSWREPIYSKYRHLRHHSKTSVIGEDPEGEVVRPKSIGLMVIEMFTRFFLKKLILAPC